MHKIRTTVVSLAAGVSLLLLSAGQTARADDGGLHLRGTDGATGTEAAPPWSAWQARVSFAAPPPAWRRGLGAPGAEGGGLSPARRPGALESFNLLGDYYFARPFALAGGVRATSGVLVGPRSQGLTLAQPNLGAGGPFSVDARGFGQSLLLRSRDDATTATPYIGLGYTGRPAGGSWSLSADVGMVGPSLGDAAGRSVGTSLRSLDEPGRDSARFLPLLQVGVLYSF